MKKIMKMIWIVNNLRFKYLIISQKEYFEKFYQVRFELIYFKKKY